MKIAYNITTQRTALLIFYVLPFKLFLAYKFKYRNLKIAENYKYNKHPLYRMYIYLPYRINNCQCRSHVSCLYFLKNNTAYSWNLYNPLPQASSSNSWDSMCVFPVCVLGACMLHTSIYE